MPEVTVVIPMFNAESYIGDCLQSIQRQDFSDLEMIIVDDGSTDNSYQIVQKFAKEDYRIRLIHKKHEGASVARNTGIEIAKGDWIMFVDSDDNLEPHLISKLYEHIDSNTDIIACCCYIFARNEKEVDRFFSEDKNFSTSKQKKELYKQLMLGRHERTGAIHMDIGVPWGKLYRRDFLKKNSLYFNRRLIMHEDNIFNMYAFFYAKEIRYLNRPLYDYRLEHIEGYHKEHWMDFLIYMSTFCEERYKCMRQLGLFQDNELNGVYKIEMLNRLWNILKYSIFISENQLSFQQKKEQALEVFDKKYFQPLFCGNFRMCQGKDKLKLFLVKGQHFRTIACVLKIIKMFRE